jgi:BioD-like phosphotransacetylase family protein
MAALYVTSTEAFSGKSALCIGLARRMRRDGRRIGYMKPISTGDRLAARTGDEDARFFKQALGLPDALENMVPVKLGPEALEEILSGRDRKDLAGVLELAYAEVATGRDVVLLEGGSNLREGALIGLTPPQVADLLNARELLVVKYKDGLQVMDDALIGMARLGGSCIGVVLNCIPRPDMPFVEEVVRPALEGRGIPVLAVIPQERLLQSITVGELATLLSGEILCGWDSMDELVEHLMVGAMGVESALTLFRRKPNKAVITGGDRSDIQLAALETSTKCLILTGDLRPSPIIQSRAEEVGVPMVLVRQDTLTAVEAIEQCFGRTRFSQPQKVERFDELLADRFDFERLYAALGLG